MPEEYDGLCLHELVAESSWEKVLKRLQTHPHEALHIVDSLAWLETAPRFAQLADDSNISALHLMCAQEKPPRQVLRVYLETQPKAIKILTTDNKSPLLLACRAKQRPEKLAILIHADPDAVLVQDIDGSNPLHVCCIDGAQENSIRVLLDGAGAERTERALLACDRGNHYAPIHCACNRASQIRIEDFALVYERTRVEALAVNPLRVLCQEFQQNFQYCLRTSRIPTAAVSTSDPSPYCNQERVIPIQRFWMWRPTDVLFLRRAWNMAFTLLGAHGSDLSTYPLLHECLERDPECACDMFDYILCLNPHYACQIRDDGLLPLHVICRLAAQAGERQWAERIRKLVQLYPKAASIPDADGNLPLEILARPTVTYELVGPVFESYPSALARFDLPETLYPYVMSQLARRRCINGIFQVIRDKPTLAAIR